MFIDHCNLITPAPFGGAEDISPLNTNLAPPNGVGQPGMSIYNHRTPNGVSVETNSLRIKLLLLSANALQCIEYLCLPRGLILPA
jgi:hypothetical protein